MIQHRKKYRTVQQFTNITKDVNDFLNGEGFCVIKTMHTTAKVKILEDELLSLYDITKLLETLVPDIKYAHDHLQLRTVPPDERINGKAHLMSLFFEDSLIIPFQNGTLQLGKWESLFLVELDGERDREVLITCLQ